MTDEVSGQVIEVVDASLTPAQQKDAWVKRVFERSRNCCSNCGSDARVRVKMIVPLEAGGQLNDANGVLLCRACEIAAEVTTSLGSGSAQRPVNFWVSTRLYTKIKTLNGFKSMGSLIRYLMQKYVLDDARFDDLEQYQETGSDIKINVWVDSGVYGTFKEMVNVRGISVTDALKALIRMYEEEAEPLVRSQK